ncbi:MAG: hypothetical protein ACLUSP_04915 [Christensenellales bacterium]
MHYGGYDHNDSYHYDYREKSFPQYVERLRKIGLVYEKHNCV